MKNEQYEILTDHGWCDFSGIRKIEKKQTYEVITELNKKVVCCGDHKFFDINGEILFKDIIVGNTKIKTIDGYELVVSIKEDIIQDVFDITDVNNETHSYIGDDIISHNCQFQGSSITLIDANHIVDHLKWEEPILRPDDYTIVWEAPKYGRKYLLSIDTAGGVGSDFSVMNVFDITDYPYGPAKQVAIWSCNTKTPPMFAEMVYDCAKYWNEAFIIGEINGLSNEVLNLLMDKYEYENLYYDIDDQTYGIYSDKTSKKIACMHFKEELENHRMKIVDTETITEIGYFEEESPGIYKAKRGKNLHDDRVITCVWAAYFLKSKFFEDIKEDFDKERFEQNEEGGTTDNERIQAEENLQAFLDADKRMNTESWLDDEEMNQYRNR